MIKIKGIKIIEALKEAGIYDHIVETIVDVRNRYGAKDATKGITMILKTEMIRNPKLLDVFMDDIEDLGFKNSWCRNHEISCGY